MILDCNADIIDNNYYLLVFYTIILVYLAIF